MSATTAANPSPAASKDASLTLELKMKQDARRRGVAATEKRSSTDGGINGVSGDNMLAGGRELSHTIRGESLHERPKDIPEVRAGLASSKAASRRKKVMPKTENPKWQLVVSTLTMIFFLLVAILWLGQLIWKWRDMLNYSSSPPFAVLDSESRLLEVEASLKSTAKMLQVQMDVVGKKVSTEAETAKKELKKQMEEKVMLLEKGLKKLDVRTDNLDKTLTDLKVMDFLPKEEFQSFLKDLKSKSSDNSDPDVSLDAIRDFAKQIVEKEIEKHAADGLGRVDYALASGGARVVKYSEPYNVGKSGNLLTIAKGQNRVHPNAQKMLEPSFGEPGQCFALQGNRGFVEIKLRKAIVPEALTLEHVSKSVAYDRSSAPKDCQVYGWFQAPGDDPSNHSEKMFLLTEFSYDLEKSNAQTFNVEITNSSVINMVRLEFSSNYGSSTVTCIYRLRVHGFELNSTAEALQA